MNLTTYQILMLLMAVVIQTAGFTAYISKIKNDLNTRVAVLEASHDNMVETLKEIRHDVKELLLAATS